MAVYNAIISSEYAVGAPVTSSWGGKVSNNVNAIQEGDASAAAVRIQQAALSSAVQGQLVTNGNAHNHSGGDGAQLPTDAYQNLSVTGAKVAENTIPLSKLIYTPVYTLIQTQIITTQVAFVDFVTGINSTYRTYQFIIHSLTPQVGGTSLLIRVSTNGGASFITSGYNYAGSDAGTNTSGIYLGIDVSSAQASPLSSEIIMSNATPLKRTMFKASVSYTDGSDALQDDSYTGNYGSSVAVNAVRFIASSNNINNCIISLYGVGD